MTLTRDFSALGTLQTAYRLVYCCTGEPLGQRLTVSRHTAAGQHSESVLAGISEGEAEEILRYLYENEIAMEHWQDVLEDLLPGKLLTH